MPSLKSQDVPGQAKQEKIPIVYSTDLYHPHDDPDDHFDLATLFALSEFDIRGIILDGGKRQRESPGQVAVEQMMYLTGRKVPVTVGLAQPLRGPQDTGADQPEEFQDGVRLLLEVLAKSNESVILFTTGSLRDVAAAYLREPELFRQRVARFYINIGDAFGGQEHNVNLDPWAYRIIMRSNLPVYWCPCFAGGVWKRDKGLATYWRFRHGEVLTQVPLPVRNFFLYALRKERASPLEYLQVHHPEEHYAWLFGLDRNMWCTAPMLHAAGRSIVEVSPGRFAAPKPWQKDKPPEAGKTNLPPATRSLLVFSFGEYWIREIPTGQFTICEAPNLPDPTLRKIHCFGIKDLDRYDAIMTSVLTELFRDFPLVDKAR
ncbi:MAG: nucleoside hydrolase [Gemmataceae bacterium]|nr:nucleoside hydrolase [Gemmataceae bacterium]